MKILLHVLNLINLGENVEHIVAGDINSPLKHYCTTISRLLTVIQLKHTSIRHCYFNY